MEGKKQMLATLVGCNYAGTPHELRGCINDVLAMRDTLVARFGFAPGDITVLTDDDTNGGVLIPTGANIKRALCDMHGGGVPRCARRRALLSLQRPRHARPAPPPRSRP
ncbi:unnamed protein product [Urochloa humidicola]